jgi:succinoglycan biosynthesis protein ExoO
MKSRPEISVLMANFNGAKYLAPAIGSLRSQTFSGWELIVVDDVSGDDSVAIANAFAQNDSRITVIRQTENMGPAAARNRALDAARGEWLAVFDSDDIMKPDRLERLRDRARCDKAEIVADDLLVFGEGQNGVRSFLGTDYARAPRWIGLAEFIDSNRLYSSVPDLGYLKPMIRAQLLQRSAIRYDERLRIGEDYDFIARLLAFGARIRLEPASLYMYRKHAGSTSHRIAAGHIRELLQADERLAPAIENDPEAKLALRRRRSSLEAMLAYDAVVNHVKAARYRDAAVIGLRKPAIWPLLTRPIQARLSRLVSAGRKG